MGTNSSRSIAGTVLRGLGGSVAARRRVSVNKNRMSSDKTPVLVLPSTNSSSDTLLLVLLLSMVFQVGSKLVEDVSGTRTIHLQQGDERQMAQRSIQPS
jgi:hypothetical protein